MPSIVARADDIRGFVPAIDSRKKQAINLLSGDNYLFDADGPKSGFGDQFLTAIPLGEKKFAQFDTIKTATGRRTFVFTGSTILEWIESLGNYRVITLLPVDTTLNPKRWTFAIVNEVLFFCHPSVGIYFLDDNAGTRGRLTSPGVLQQPIAIDENSGRLIVLNRTTVQWSGQNNGFDHAPALGGPGFQVVGARVAGDPISVKSYGAGFLVFTKGGIMRSEFTADQAVYRHRELATDYTPVNTFCIIANEDDLILFLDERGVFQTTGGPPTAFTPLFNEFLRAELKKASFLFETNVRIEWDKGNQYLYLLTSSTDITPEYDRTFVLFPPADKWGTFNVKSFGLGNIHIPTGTRKGSYLAHVDEGGRIKFFDESASRKAIPTDPSTYYFKPIDQYPILVDSEAGHTVMPSAVRVTHLEESVAPGLSIGGGLGGYYDFDGATPIELPTLSLAAKIRLGLFRFATGEYPDELSEVTDMAITSVVSGDKDPGGTDFDILPDGVGDQDFETQTAGEDFGNDPQTFVNFDLRLISTMDGQKAFSTVSPTLQRFFNSTRYFAGGEDGKPAPVGVWHILEMSTSKAGQTFHLKQVEMNGILAGRLS